MIRKSICGLTVEEIFDLIRPSGFTRNHALLISKSIYKKSTDNLSQIPKIPKKLINELGSIAKSGIFQPVASEVSADKTVKYLFRTETGKKFETVYIPDNKRNTVCVSSQSGCRMGCAFCVTSKYGFHGNLSAGEIVNQIISLPGSEKITHVVFMGMGEPMDNLENVLKACKIITAEWGLAISPRNVTVSTVGLIATIEKFLQTSDCNLTLSLHSPFIKERKKFIPAELKNPAHRIIEIMKNYPIKKKRRLSIAYVMIRDMNDTDDHLEELKAMLKGSMIRVNLIPYHFVRSEPYISSPEEILQKFKHNLIISGISASVRKSRGIDISAACGLLATGLINPLEDILIQIPVR
jgi:23S rRNA (adenine2503-C2)-methyltransferase